MSSIEHAVSPSQAVEHSALHQEPDLGPPQRPPEAWSMQCLPVRAHGGNAEVAPVYWAMEVKQIQDFMQACRQTQKWKELKDEEIWLDNQLVKPKGYVSGHQLCKHFVKPWTSNAGCSLALLMNEVPIKADIMLVHSWDADVEEVFEALRDVPLTQSIWLSMFAMYHSEEHVAIAPNPFKHVILHVHEIRVVHTSQSDVHSCPQSVLEIGEALKRNVAVQPFFSRKYLRSYLETSHDGNSCWGTIDTPLASVSCVEDTKTGVEAVANMETSLLPNDTICKWKAGISKYIWECASQLDGLTDAVVLDQLNKMLAGADWSAEAVLKKGTHCRKTVAIFADYDGCFDIISPSNPKGAKMDQMFDYAAEVGALIHPKKYAENLLTDYLKQITAGADEVILLSGSNRQCRRSDTANSVQNDNGLAVPGLKQLAKQSGWDFDAHRLEDVGMDTGTITDKEIKRALVENNFTRLPGPTEVYFFDDVPKYLKYVRDFAEIPADIEMKTVLFDWYGICIDGAQDGPLVSISAN